MITKKKRLQTTQHTAVELSQTAVQIVSNLHAPQQWVPDLPFLGKRSCGPAGYLALLTKAGDVETNPGPTTLNKRVWICDICYIQIHVRKQISIRCNKIEHWVHLRCAGIRQAQYTDSWTCHLHRESRHNTRCCPSPLPTPHLCHSHHCHQNTDTRPTLPLLPQDW